MRSRKEQFGRFGRLIAVALVFGFAALWQAMPALAHGGAELTVTPATVAPGGTIQVKAEGVEAGEEFTITLEGLKGEVALGVVTVGDDEDFHEDYTLPADIQSGVYQVTAVSGEGEALTAELTVEAGATGEETSAMPEPSAELMQLDRSKSVGEWAVVIVGLLLSAGVGLALVIKK
jgi:hypothetical protein